MVWVVRQKRAAALNVRTGGVLPTYRTAPNGPCSPLARRWFSLYPVGILAGDVGVVRLLRDNPLKAHFLKDLEQLLRVGKFLGVAQRVVVGLDQKAAERVFAIRQPALAQVATIQFEQIEAPGAQPVHIARHQNMEIRMSVISAGDELRVDDRGGAGKAGYGVAELRETRGEVASVAAEEGNGIAGLVELDAPAVEFDLVNPPLAGDRDAARDRRRRKDEGRVAGHAAYLGRVLGLSKTAHFLLLAKAAKALAIAGRFGVGKAVGSGVADERVLGIDPSKRDTVGRHDAITTLLRPSASKSTVPMPPLDASRSMLLTMALHELATNAAQYGALSSDTGQISINWTALDTGEDFIRLYWQEQGGPTVQPPGPKGFGSRLIENSFEKACIDYAPDGLACVLDIRNDQSQSLL